MSGMTASFNLLPGIINLMGDIPDKLVTEAAKQIMAQAQTNAPEATGYMASSIYMKTNSQSTYGNGIGDPPEDSYALEEIETPPSGTAYVAVAANYGIYVELGTRKMGAEPFLIPALELVGQSFQNGTMLSQVLAEGIAGL
jgi:HK97 gp10 family phage protein